MSIEQLDPPISSELYTAIINASGEELIDEDGWLIDVGETRESLDEWEQSSKTWRSKTAAYRGTFCGGAFIAWGSMQLRKGDTRDSISVIDLGDMRYVFHQCDLRDFSNDAEISEKRWWLQ